MQCLQNLSRRLRHDCRRLIQYLLIVTSMQCSAVHASELEDLLDDLRWQARILLVFAAENEDARTAEFAETVAGRACELEEREILIGRINANGESQLADRVFNQSASRQVREKFRIGPDDFRILLIGKDGGVKARYDQVPDLLDVFALIDGMPMRRRELRTRSTDCAE